MVALPKKAKPCLSVQNTSSVYVADPGGNAKTASFRAGTPRRCLWLAVRIWLLNSCNGRVCINSKKLSAGEEKLLAHQRWSTLEIHV